MLLLEDRIVLVTGAGRGIGRGIAEAVAEAGGKIAATDVDPEAARKTASRVETAGGSALALKLDVTDEDSIRRAIDHTGAHFGRLDGLVNNAGVLLMAEAETAAGEEWRTQFEVNLFGVAACCRQAARLMKSRGGGAIVNVASNAGKVGYRNMAVYNASKAAVINLTRTLALEWFKEGINVNAVCPGGVDTPMLADVARWVGERTDRDPRALLDSMVPAQMGRHIRPIEVGRVVAFLLSPQAQIIRGQAINVDGGDTPY